MGGLCIHKGIFIYLFIYFTGGWRDEKETQRYGDLPPIEKSENPAFPSQMQQNSLLQSNNPDFEPLTSRSDQRAATLILQV